MAALTNTGRVDPLGELQVLPGNSHSEKQKTDLRQLLMQQSGGLNEIVMVLVRMKPGADPNQNRVGWNAKLFSHRCRSGWVGLHEFEIEAVRNQLESLWSIVELFVVVQRGLRTKHDSRCELPRQRSASSIHKHGAALIGIGI